MLHVAQFLNTDAQKIAAWTFLILMFLGGLFVVAGAFFSGTEARAWTTTVLLRGADIISVMAASLLIFIVISARNDAILSLLGVLVIAAVIVPTQELARLAGLAGIGDGVGAEQSARLGRGALTSQTQSDLTAGRIVTDLLVDEAVRTRLMNGDELRRNESEVRKRLQQTISTALYRYDLEALEGSVRQRALEHTLLSTLNEERLRQIALTPVQARIAKAELFALRDAGLVTLWQSEIPSARVTPLGMEVLCRINGHRPEVQEAAPRIGLTRPSLANMACVPVTTGRGTTDAPTTVARRFTWTGATRPPFSEQLDVRGPEGVLVTFEIKDMGPPVPVLIETRNPSSRFDPFLVLLGDNNVELASDDDSAGNLNARIVRSLVNGTYSVRMTNVTNAPGTATLDIRPLSPDAAWPMLTPIETTDQFPLDGAPPRVPLPLQEAAGPTGVVRDLPPNGTLFSFTVAPDAKGAYVIDVRAVRGRMDIDMALYRIAAGGIAQLVEYNDDRSPTGSRNEVDALNPLIRRLLDDGDYVLRIRDRDGRPTVASIRITREARAD